MPYISLYGPTRPLLIWSLVSALCGLLLLVETVALVVQTKGNVRWLAIVPLVDAIAAFVLANQVWAAYLAIACPYPGRFPPLQCFDSKLAAQAVARFQPLGWAMVGVTVVLLVAGVVVTRPAPRVAS